MNPQTTSVRPQHETYAKQVAAAVIEDWRKRPRLRRGGEPFVKTLVLDAHLSPEAETELRELLTAAGLEFDTNQVLSGGKIQKQTNIIHIQRMVP